MAKVRRAEWIEKDDVGGKHRKKGGRKIERKGIW